MFHRNSFIFLCLLLFLSISTPVFAAEEPDLSGGVITSIPRQRFLENINPTHFSTATDPEELLSYLQEQLQNISSLTAIVSKDGQTYETELSLSWSDFPEDVTKAGSYELTGTILPPQGCTFADGVMTSIRIPYIIHDASVKSAITSLFNIQTGITGMIFEVHDDSSWNEQRDLLHSFLATAVCGLTADGRSAKLVLDQFDDHSVNINVPGEYEILISYSLADSCQNQFTLPDDLKTWHIPVKVSDPSVYELWTPLVSHGSTKQYLESLSYSFFSIQASALVQKKVLMVRLTLLIRTPSTPNGTASATAALASIPPAMAAGIAIHAARPWSLGMFPPASIPPMYISWIVAP